MSDSTIFDSYCEFIDCCRRGVGNKYRMFKSYSKDLSTMRDVGRRNQEMARFREWLRRNSSGIKSRKLIDPMFDSKHTIYFKSVLDLGNESTIEEFWLKLSDLESALIIDGDSNVSNGDVNVIRDNDGTIALASADRESSIDDQLTLLLADPIIADIVSGLQDGSLNIKTAIQKITRQIKSANERRKIISVTRKILALTKEKEFINKAKANIVSALVCDETSVDKGVDMACSMIDDVLLNCDESILDQCFDSTANLLDSFSESQIDTFVDYISNIFNQENNLSEIFQSFSSNLLADGIVDVNNPSNLKERIDYIVGMLSTVNVADDPCCDEITNALKRYVDRPDDQNNLASLGKFYEKLCEKFCDVGK